MVRKKPTPGEKGEPVSLRVDPDIIAALDDEAQRMSAAMGVPVSRSAVIRLWLREAFDKRRHK